jgi:hypothetical protein
MIQHGRLSEAGKIGDGGVLPLAFATRASIRSGTETERRSAVSQKGDAFPPD